jgi:hypothetical protein
MRRIGCGRRLAFLRFAAESSLVLILKGCAVPMKMPARTNGPMGKTIQKDNIDLTFLQAGTTRREDVVKRLDRIDTGYSSSRMFWGRWSESKSGIAMIGLAGGQVARNWRVHNLLVSFDENGVMQSKDLIDGEKALERELRAQLEKAPPLDLSQIEPVGLTFFDAEGHPRYGVSEIILTKDGMLVRNMEMPSRPSSFEISPINVTRISYVNRDSESSGAICHILDLSQKTPSGKSFDFCTSAANLATIIKYFQQTGPPNMRWE